MATLQGLRSEVEVWLRDLPADTATAIPQLINEAIRELQRKHNFRCMEALASFVTTFQSNALGVISDYKEPRAKPYWVDYDDSTNSMDWQPSLDFLIQRYQNDSTGAPAYVFVSGMDAVGAATMQVYPKADGISQWPDKEYRLFLPYWKYLPALVVGTDTNWFTVFAEKYIRLHAVGWGTLLNIDEARGATYLRAAEGEASRLISADKRERVAQPQVFKYSVNAGEPVDRFGRWAR